MKTSPRPDLKVLARWGELLFLLPLHDKSKQSAPPEREPAFSLQPTQTLSIEQQQASKAAMRIRTFEIVSAERFAGAHPVFFCSLPCEGEGRGGGIAAPHISFIFAAVQPEGLPELAPVFFFPSPCEGGGREGVVAAPLFTFISAFALAAGLPGRAPTLFSPPPARGEAGRGALPLRASRLFPQLFSRHVCRFSHRRARYFLCERKYPKNIACIPRR